MKKLLALILCVMMFVAVIPTSAFAAPTAPATYPTIDNPLMSVAQYNKEIKNMIANSKAAIQTVYGILVGDKVVYSTAKGMDDTIVALVDGLAKDLVAKNITLGAFTFNKAYVDSIKDQVRLVMDDLVAKSMTKNAYKYTNPNGTQDPIKYAQTFSQAVCDALTNKQFQKGYEAVATFIALCNLHLDVNSKIAAEYAAFADSVDMKFDADFQDKYPQLWLNYIDTLTDAANGYEIDDPWALAAILTIPDPFTADHAQEEAPAEDQPADPQPKGDAAQG